MIKVEKENLVVKHNALINATSNYKYERNELKLICILVSNIDNQKEKDFETKYIDLGKLDFSEEDISNKEYIKNLCLSILTKPFMINSIAYNWFSSIGYKNGVIEYKFDPDLKPFLLELKDNFTRYHITDILKLRSSYSIQVFELLTQYKVVGIRTMTIEEFREILSIPSTYKNNDLKRLLETIQKDLKEHTHVNFKFEIEKLGRKFHKIHFEVKDNFEKIETIKTQRKAKKLEGAITLQQRLKVLKLEDH